MILYHIYTFLRNFSNKKARNHLCEQISGNTCQGMPKRVSDCKKNRKSGESIGIWMGNIRNEIEISYSEKKGNIYVYVPEQIDFVCSDIRSHSLTRTKNRVSEHRSLFSVKRIAKYILSQPFP